MVRSFGRDDDVVAAADADTPPVGVPMVGGPHGGDGAGPGVVQVNVTASRESLDELAAMVRAAVESAVRAGFLDALNDPDGPYPDLP